MMIKFNGPNCYQGDGDRYLFGDFLKGGGSGKGINYWYLSYYFGNEWGDGNGWGDGCYFGGGTGKGFGDGYFFGDIKGSGNSYFSYKLLKKEFQK